MQLKLIKKLEEAKDTKSFFFEGSKDITWLPGQYYYFTIPNLSYPDPRGPTRHFTISASPTEGPTLRLTTRVRSDSGFKQSLNELPLNTVIEGEGPNGTFILDENESGNHVFLAGGIGITPFRSFIKYNIDKGLVDISLHLICANSTPEEIAFRKDLADWGNNYKNIRVDFTITKPEESKEKWNGLTGRIEENLIRKLAGERLSTSTFWVCGPPPMVEAMEKVLGSLKITSDRVRTEKFTGY